MLLGVVSSNCCVDTTVRGVGELATSVMTRDPVTNHGLHCAVLPGRRRSHGLGAGRIAEQAGEQCNNGYGGF